MCSVKCLVFGVWCVVFSAAPNEKPPAAGAAVIDVGCLLFKMWYVWSSVQCVVCGDFCFVCRLQ